MTASTWPDPARPGVPLNPDRDGWHWLKTERGLAPWRWKENPESIMWESGWEAGDGVISPAYFAALGPCTYLSPVLLPDEATALQARVAGLEVALATARREGMEEAAQIVVNAKDAIPWGTVEMGCERIAAEIRAAAKEGKP